MKNILLFLAFLLFGFSFGIRANPFSASEQQYIGHKGLFKNSGFEQGFKHWTTSGNCSKSTVSQVPFLNKSARFICTSQSFTLSQAVSIPSDYLGSIVLSCKIKTNDKTLSLKAYSGATLKSTYHVASDNKLHDNNFLLSHGVDKIEISNTSTTSETIIDDCDIKTDESARTLISKISNVSKWGNYTPTFQGWSVTLVDSKYRVEGDSIRISYRGTITSTNSQEWQISLPSGFTVSNEYSGVVKIGTLDASYSTDTHYSILATANDSFLNIGFRNASSSATFAPRPGNQILGSGAPFQIEAVVKVNELEAPSVAVTQEKKVSRLNKDSFFIKIGTGGIVEVDDYDIIDGNCALSGTNNETKTCTYNTGIFTEAPTPIAVACATQIDRNVTVKTPLSVNEFEFTSRTTGHASADNGACFLVGKRKVDQSKKIILQAPLIQEQYFETETQVGLWNGEKLYRRCFTVASDSTGTLNFGTWEANLKPKKINNYNGTRWDIELTEINGNITSIFYDSATGEIKGSTAGGYKVGAGTSFCMEYTK